MTTLLEQINTHETKGSIKDLVFPVSNTYNFENKKRVIFVNTSDVHEGKFLHSAFSEVEKLPGQAKKIIEKGDILFSEIRPKNRHFALVDFDAREYVVSTKLIVLKVKENVDPIFAYTVLTADRNLKEFQNIAESRSGTFPQITFDSIADYEIRLPDFPTQKKIADLLGAYQEKIETNNVILKNLELLAQAIFDEWFVKLNFPGSHKAKLNNDESEGLQEGWIKSTLSEIVDVNPPTKVISGSVSHADMKDLSETGMYFSTEKKDSQSTGSRFKNHDTLIARITPCLENGKAGYVSCLNENEVATGSTEFLVLRPKKEEYREFIYLLARDEKFRNFAIGRMVGSSGRQRVSGDDIGSFKFAKPNLELIQKFHSIFEPIFQNIKIIAEENQNLKLVKDQLLAKLI